MPLAIAAINAGYEVCVLTQEHQHGDIIRKAGIRLIPFKMSRSSMNPFTEIAMFLRLLSVYKLERPDLVHHVAMKPVLYGSIAARIVGVSCVINALAGLGWLFTSSSGKASLLRRPLSLVLRMAMKHYISIVQNPDDVLALQQMGLHKHRIRMIRGSGVDTNIYTPRKLTDGIPLVILPARLLWDKGVGEFVEAARKIRQAGIVSRFALVGAPDPMNPASISVKQLNAWKEEGVVELWGQRNDMPDVYNQAQIVCLPSYREGLPKSLIEAAASGRAIVTTDAPGCREVVRQGENGFLVPVGDVGALCDALLRLLSNAELCKTMGNKSRRIALDEFCLDRVVDTTLEIYQSCLK